MSATDTLHKLRAVIDRILGCERHSVDTDQLMRDLGMDSLDTVELEMECEEEFGLGENGLENTLGVDMTVADLAKLIDERRGVAA